MSASSTEEKQVRAGASPPEQQQSSLPSHDNGHDRHHDAREGVVGLEQLGVDTHEKATRTLGLLGIVAVGYNICNSWVAVASTLVIGISQGGSVTIIYGAFLTLAAYAGICTTLAELASVYPTAGGQYHWTSILSPKKTSRGLSYCCGFINLLAWIATSTGVTVILPQLISATVVYYHPSYAPQRWHLFLLYQGFNVLVMCYNVWGLRRTTWLINFGFALSIITFITVMTTCLARSPAKQSSEFVWTTFINTSGWSANGVVFLTGLITPNYMFAGIDGAIHLAEEVTNAAVAVPRALFSTLTVGFTTAFIFVIAMLYSMTDFDAVLRNSTGAPILEIWVQATRSPAAATAFIVLTTVLVLFALIGCQQTSSRLTWAFARDNALLYSPHIAHMNQKLGVPVNALQVNAAAVALIGFIFLGSTTAFNAFLGTGLILQQLSFIFPAALLLYRRRSTRFLPPQRFFRVPSPVGYAANAVTIAFGTLTLIAYNLPIVMPVSGGTMNYTSAVLGCMALFAGANWWFHARKHYHGPRLPDELRG